MHLAAFLSFIFTAVMPVLDTGIHSAGLMAGCDGGGMDPVVKPRGDGGVVG